MTHNTSTAGAAAQSGARAVQGGNEEDTERTSLRALNQALKDYIIQSNNISAMVSLILHILKFLNCFLTFRDFAVSVMILINAHKLYSFR